ncbi:hypothetical protein EVAR_89553_1 [Eumeta japonica]|uniref:Uncharacterized protein n=1 Tax=Eumeta variegata TaxID=151549 RepID=A0A4C1ZA39_EUMVA|nr:hypothetical protein EVAR_89553_1 [Eumeta japonica]
MCRCRRAVYERDRVAGAARGAPTEHRAPPPLGAAFISRPVAARAGRAAPPRAPRADEYLTGRTRPNRADRGAARTSPLIRHAAASPRVTDGAHELQLVEKHGPRRGVRVGPGAAAAADRCDASGWFCKSRANVYYVQGIGL